MGKEDAFLRHTQTGKQDSTMIHTKIQTKIRTRPQTRTHKSRCLRLGSLLGLALGLLACAGTHTPARVSRQQWEGTARMAAQDLRKDSNDLQALESAAVAAYHLGDYAQAQDHYLRLIALDGGLASHWFNLGMSALGAGDTEEAVSAFTEATTLDPDHLRAWSHLGYAYIGQQAYPEAIYALDQALRIDPHLLSAYLNRGAAHYYAGEHENAIRDFSSIISRQPDHAEAYARRALAQYSLGNLDYAREDLDAALARDSLSSVVWYYEGLWASSTEQWEAARAAYDKAIGLQPDPAYYRARSLVLFKLGDTLRAHADFERGK
ncbi:MAG: hypothetical protein OHK0039_40780 [Bacteroidia bacterium]